MEQRARRNNNLNAMWGHRFQISTMASKSATKKAVLFRLSIPMAPFWSKGNFPHHFISARFQKCFYIPNLGTVGVKSSEPLPTVPKFGTLEQKWPFCHFVNGQKGHFCPNVPNFGTVGDSPEYLTFQLRDRPWRSWRFDVLTSGPSPMVPNFGM